MDIKPARPVASMRYWKSMVPERPSLVDHWADTGRPVSAIPLLRAPGSKLMPSTLTLSKLLAPFFVACLNNSSSDSERTTFHECPLGPFVLMKSVSESSLAFVCLQMCIND